MCSSCFTALDSLFINSAGAAAGAGAVWSRLRDRIDGQGELRRARRIEQDRRFIAGLGLDPNDVLGPVPQRSAREPMRSGSG